MTSKYLFPIFFLFAPCLSNIANCQDQKNRTKVNCDECKTYAIEKDNKVTLISCELAKKYINNYQKKYRRSEKLKRHHPEFVNFSAKTLLDIYTFFKADKLNEYRGIDFYFSFLDKKAPRQIQLFLTPEKKDTSSDFKKFNLLSNTGTNYYNQLLDPVDAYQHKENYEDFYRSKKKHTKSVFLDTANFRFIGSFFSDVAYKKYKGVRVYFASYNKYLKREGRRIKNGQVRRKEITLVLEPVNESGEPDFCAFGKFWRTYPKFDDSGLNHGTLCPSECPDGGN